MELLLLLGATLIIGYYTFLVWKRPERVREYLRNFYNESVVKEVASSMPAFWFVRLFVSLMFILSLGLFISGILSLLPQP